MKLYLDETINYPSRREAIIREINTKNINEGTIWFVLRRRLLDEQAYAQVPSFAFVQALELLNDRLS